MRFEDRGGRERAARHGAEREEGARHVEERADELRAAPVLKGMWLLMSEETQ